NFSVFALDGNVLGDAHTTPVSTSTHLRIVFTVDDGITRRWDLFGSGFTYDEDHVPTGGTVTRWTETMAGARLNEWSDPSLSATQTITGSGGLRFDITGFSTPMSGFAEWAGSGESDVFAAIFAGNDTITGSSIDWTVFLGGPFPTTVHLGDQLRGYGGNDTLNGSGGPDD